MLMYKKTVESHLKSHTHAHVQETVESHLKSHIHAHVQENRGEPP